MDAKSSVEAEPDRREVFLVNGGGEHEQENGQVQEQEPEKEVVHPLTAFLTMAGFASDEDEEGEEDDEEWRPNILCTNCTMANPSTGSVAITAGSLSECTFWSSRSWEAHYHQQQVNTNNHNHMPSTILSLQHSQLTTLGVL